MVLQQGITLTRMIQNDEILFFLNGAWSEKEIVRNIRIFPARKRNPGFRKKSIQHADEQIGFL